MEPHFVTDVTEIRANPVVSRRGHLLLREVDRRPARGYESDSDDEDGGDGERRTVRDQSGREDPEMTSGECGWSKKWVVSA